ncbi:3-oxoacyl-reductase [Cladochytrium replicatum]|nr:3-oxoacyl-reductase [Cladochytrium replicatum]
MVSTAVITGASGAIGLAIARTIVTRHSMDVVLIGRRTDALERAKSAIRTHTTATERRITTIPCDVADPEDVAGMAKCAMEEATGDISCVVNAAGISIDGLLMTQPLKDISSIVTTNLIGTINVTRAFLKPMIKQRSGSVINISSVVGISGNQGQSVYAASKAGIIGFTKSLAKEIGPRGLRVNAIAPGFIESDMTSGISDEIREKYINACALRRFGTPEEVAHCVSFLLEARYITGQCLVVDGGLSI